MNEYVVTFITNDEEEVGLLLKIEVTVNRPNNPDDDELIMDYLNQNYGKNIDYGTLHWHVLDHVVEITSDYCVEV